MIYTSYFGRMKELERNGIIPIAISQGVPKGYDGIRILSLAPSWAMLKMSDEQYNAEYEKILAKNDRDELAEMFEGRDVALLCWEKDVNDCHRKRVAEWFREGGYEVEEYEPEGKKEEKKHEEKTVAEKASKNDDIPGQISMFKELGFCY